MKRVLCCVLVAMVVVGFSGCGKKEEPIKQPGMTLGDVGQETAEAGSAAAQYLAQQKDKVIAEAQDQLAYYQDQLNVLRAAAEAKGDQAVAIYEEKKSDLDRSIAMAKKEVADAKEASAEAWDAAVSGLARSMDELKNTFQNVADALK